MVITPFDRYRTSLGSKPITDFERRTILNPLLQDSTITKMIGLKMITDGNADNNLLGLMLAAGGSL